MGDYDGIGEGFCGLLRLFGWAAALSIPLAVWKLVEIAMWVCRHVSVSFGG